MFHTGDAGPTVKGELQTLPLSFVETEQGHNNIKMIGYTLHLTQPLYNECLLDRSFRNI